MTKEAKEKINQVRELSDKDLSAAVGGATTEEIYEAKCTECPWSFGPTNDAAAVNNAANEHSTATGHVIYITGTATTKPINNTPMVV